ncbi:hypothetical protein [Flavobacterium sp.]|uniref:hypothetical protein n=1 Tax=Flavobacterium sp. TaxID=239 RepID=UPI00120F9DCA|nr:hypothetical protein [Flavobacterium sp.]RZJ70222.1 MAG: hypothetical protein EOO49_14650 [Flavobacterium sp.]
MKKLLFLFLLIAFKGHAQVDPKEASSDKAAMMEGQLRGSKPTFEKKLTDGTELSVWILGTKNAESQSAKHIVKALAKRQTALSDEGKKTEKADFSYENGKISEVHFTEVQIIQKPNPSVTNMKKEIVFTDGVQTSPTVGSLPEIEKFVNECLSEINKIPL